MRYILTIALMLFIATPLAAADLHTALFGKGGIFENEGDYQNLRNDGGNWSSGKVGVGKMCGGTKYGISCAWHPGVDVKNLTKAQAAEIYRKNYWSAIKGDEIASQKIANKLMDLAVNCGSGTALGLLRKTIADLGGPAQTGSRLTTAEAVWINSYTRSNYLTDGTDKSRRKLFYRTLVLESMVHYVNISKNPVRRQWFYTWAARAMSSEE